MPDYQRMYTLLFNRITDVIQSLQEVQQIAEEMYINAPELRVVQTPTAEE